jgi:fructokinase
VVAATRHGIRTRPGRQVDVVDAIGAGDAFLAALLAGLHDRDLLGARHRPALVDLPTDTLAAVLDQAVLASALTCARRGADPPTRADLTCAV